MPANASLLTVPIFPSNPTVNISVFNSVVQLHKTFKYIGDRLDRYLSRNSLMYQAGDNVEAGIQFLYTVNNRNSKSNIQ